MNSRDSERKYSRVSALGLTLRRAMEAQGLSQSALDRRSGVRQSVISRILSGETTRLQVPTLKKLADALGMTPSELSGSSDFPRPATPTDEPVCLISSTHTDLAEHRKEVMDACLRMGLVPKVTEHLPAAANDAVAETLRGVDEADAFIGIYGHRYGHVPEGRDVSITEMEYNRAVERHLPRFIFLMHDDHLIKPRDVETGLGRQKLKELRVRVAKEQAVNFFKSAADLRALIINTLSQLREPDQTKRQYLDKLRATEPALRGRHEFLPDYPEPQPKWVGRRVEMNELHRAWRDRRRRIQAVVGFGGEGKTALARRFTESLRRATHEQDGPLVVWWSFYFNKAADAFFAAVLTHFGIPLTEEGRPLAAEQRARKLVDLLRTGVSGRRLLLVLDGLETLQNDTPGREGRVTDTGLRKLLRTTLNDAEPDGGARGMILITTREPLADLRRDDDPGYGELDLEQLSVPDGVALLTQHYGLKIEQDDAERFVKDVGGHALTLTLTGALHAELPGTTNLADLRRFIAGEEAKVTDPGLTTRRAKYYRLPGYVLRNCAAALSGQERQFLRLLSCCVRPATRQDVEQVFLHTLRSETDDESFNDQVLGLDYVSLRTGVVARLVRLGLVHGREVDEHAEGGQEETGLDMHPLVRRHFYEDDPDAALTRPQRRAVHSRFYDVLPDREEKRYPDTIEEMRPLIDAVQHGCRAGRGQAAFFECYYSRIDRKDQPLRTTGYLSSDLGAVETDLELVRGFFADQDFAREPMVTDVGAKAYLISAAALSLETTGRPDLAIPLFQRGRSASLAQSDWSGASVDCRNLCESHMVMGGLARAAEAASNALDFAGKMPDGHERKNGYTELSHGSAATIAALGGDDETASGHFAAALKLGPDDWLGLLDGCWHCTWLARRGQFDRARPAGQENAAWCQAKGGLHSQTFALATQGLIERLAWAADDPHRAGLEVMAGHARRAVDIGRRSGDHFYLTCALLEAGRCAVTSARHQRPDRQAHVAEATRYLDEAEQRAADVGYRLILADLHVARAELAKLAGDDEAMCHHCREAIAICEAPDCGYAWAKQDAEALLADPAPPRDTA